MGLLQNTATDPKNIDLCRRAEGFFVAPLHLHRYLDTNAIHLLGNVPVFSNQRKQIFSGNDMIAGLIQKDEGFIVILHIIIILILVAPGDPHD